MQHLYKYSIRAFLASRAQDSSLGRSLAPWLKIAGSGRHTEAYNPQFPPGLRDTNGNRSTSGRNAYSCDKE